MKEDKEKEAKLEAVKKELNSKIEKLMGPSPEDQAPANKRISPAKAADPKANRKTSKPAQPTTAPTVGEAEPVKEPEFKSGPPKQDEQEPELDPEINKAVDDIASNESDELLKAEDEEVKRAFEPKTPRTLSQKIKDFFKDLWQDPKKRKVTIGTTLAIFALLMIVPNSRYFILNLIGIRSSASVKVLDASTQQPLKNVNVTLSGQSGQTDDEGYVKLSRIKLGKNDLKVERRAFATTEKKITIGWGSNPLGDYPLTPTGLQYAFKTTDFLSGNAIQKAEATSGYASAFSNENGEILLTLDTKSDEDVQVMITAEGYRTETLTATAQDDGTIDVKMAPYLRHTFVSKRSGKFDIYKIDGDGKNEELVLSGTGHERDDIVLAPHPYRNVTAMVSTRENMRNVDGYQLSTLYMLDLETNEKQSLGLSEKYQIVGWSGDKLVYVKIAAGASASDPNRQQLISYDYDSGETKELASTNYFNDVVLAQDKIYYAPSSSYQGADVAKLYVVDPDGNNAATLIESETWNLFRSDFGKMTIAVGQAWYDYVLGGTEQPVSLNGPPADPRSRVYINSPDNKNSLWTDQRDGKGVLLVYNLESKEDKNLAAQSGLGNPVQWLNNNTAVYRVKTDQETADYVISLDGGEARKLVDVTNTSGIDNWYYH